MPFKLCIKLLNFPFLVLARFTSRVHDLSRNLRVLLNIGRAYIRSLIHERTISLRFSGIILRVCRLEVSVCNVYITNQFQTTFAQGGGGSKIR
jgi:hypothetical protein